MSDQDIVSEWAQRQKQVREVNRLLRVIVATVRNHADYMVRHYQINGAAVWVLGVLRRQPGLRPRDLARQLALHVQVVTEALAELADRKLIHSVGGEAERVRYFLTEAGVSLIDEAPGPAQGALTAALHDLDDQALATLTRTLGSLVDCMPAAVHDAAILPLTDFVPQTVEAKAGKVKTLAIPRNNHQMAAQVVAIQGVRA